MVLFYFLTKRVRKDGPIHEIYQNGEVAFREGRSNARQVLGLPGWILGVSQDQIQVAAFVVRAIPRRLFFLPIKIYFFNFIY